LATPQLPGCLAKLPQRRKAKIVAMPRVLNGCLVPVDCQRSGAAVLAAGWALPVDRAQRQVWSE